MAKSWRPFTIKSDTLTPGLKAFFKKAGVGSGDKASADFKARRAVGLALLNFSINGSSKESVVPPIRFGVLRGSGSVFVDDELVGDTKANHPDGTPNKAYDGKKGEVTIGYNTAYAAHLHETSWVPGGVKPSPQAQNNPGMLGDVGNKWVEKHLRADKETLLGVYNDILKKELGT